MASLNRPVGDAEVFRSALGATKTIRIQRPWRCANSAAHVISPGRSGDPSMHTTTAPSADHSEVMRSVDSSGLHRELLELCLLNAN